MQSPIANGPVSGSASPVRARLAGVMLVAVIGGCVDAPSAKHE